jgi:hypothetical protein
MTIAAAGLVAQLTPTQRVALTLYGEARGSSPALRVGIGNAIQHRVTPKRASWSALTADAVCLKPGQFSCWSLAGNGGPNYQTVLSAARLVALGDTVSLEQLPVLQSCLALGAEVVTGVLEDTVSGATHYYSPRSMVPPGRVPPWAMGLTPVATIDGTKFYAGVR